MPEARAIVLLEAALCILSQSDYESLNNTAFYDDANCDGVCLMNDIKIYLEYDE